MMKLATKKVYVSREIAKNSLEEEKQSAKKEELSVIEEAALEETGMIDNEEIKLDKSAEGETKLNKPAEEEIKFPQKKIQAMPMSTAKPTSNKIVLPKPQQKSGPKKMPLPEKPSIPGSSINNSLKGKSVKIVKKDPPKAPVPVKKKPLPPPIEEDKEVPGLDANIIEICMEELGKVNDFATGEPIFCHNCNALFNSFSKLLPLEESEEQVWICEFCSFENRIHVEQEEVPTQSKLVYVIESPQQVAEGIQGPDDSSTIIFCIDISGSMCVTQPVMGHIQLKTNKLEELRKQIGRNEGPQYMPKENKNITYVSRLECLQAAIEYQLTELQRGTPHRKIGIVTFNGEVNVIGDGGSQICITGDRLSNYDNIVDLMSHKHIELFSQSIGESRDQLCQRLLSLEETGPTALGPALLASVCLACQGGQGSKVIICTDGIANVGLGSLETEAEIEVAESFYSKISELAKGSGVGISVISIAGEECRLDCLSSIVEETGGNLTKVDPQNLSNDFANILAQQILAFNVTVTVNLHKGLEFRNQDPQNVYGTRLVKNLGSVTDETLFTFEYTVKKNTEIIEKIPFQVAVEHRKMNGMRCVLVDTQMVEVTENKEEVMKEADYEILARNVKVQTAKLAKQGQYGQARKNVDNWQHYMKKNVTNTNQSIQLKNMEDEVRPSYNLLAEQEEEEKEEKPINDKKSMKRQKDELSVGLHKLSKKKSRSKNE
ncbi:unnamed protein product [Blepharisma stoltei]|uniref:VWFA domain-containing protein n=1 Tax=Blepharisma stoltei TaxID=1481888 RepID=A0AAU9K8I2_9CILI|nr:unnamed protein product [Blepharisma stoltei]